MLLLGFFIFKILLLKIPFQRAHTLVIQKLNGGSIFKNLSKFSRGPSIKIIKKSLSRHHKRLRANIHIVVHW
jgi:hypothetical protein